MKYIIIGNGFAGIRAIEGIRENDSAGEITLISDEGNYSRPLISYYLGKKVTSEAMVFRDQKFFDDNKVTLKIGQKVSKVNFADKMVELGAEKLGYDKLLICTGGVPFVPPIKNVGVEGVFTFTRFDEAKTIEKYIKVHDVKNAVVLGGGLIGLKATEALMERGVQVTVVELADRVLSATFDRKASKIIETALAEAKCNVITEDTVSEVLSSDGQITGVQLKSGDKIDAKLLIVAIGVKPAVDFLKDSSIEINRGIKTNGFMETSVPDVYAAGDVVEFEGWVIAILPLAARQGRIAGFNMSLTSGDKVQYSGSIPMNSVSLAGVPTISVGLTDPKENVEDYEIIEKYNLRKKTYKKIVLLDNVIVGAIFVNDIDRAGIFTGMIKDKMDVTPFKDELQKDTFGLISLPRDYRKHMVKGDGIEI